MFNFSLLEFIKYELIVNQKIKHILEIKKSTKTDPEKMAKIMAVVKSIIADYVKSAGLTASLVTLNAVYQAEKKRLADFETALAANGYSFFSSRTHTDDGYGLYLELMSDIAQFATLLANSSEEKLVVEKISLLVDGSGIAAQVHSTLMQIYHYVERRFYQPMPTLMDFYEYLSYTEMNTAQASRSDLFQYLKNLEHYLSQRSIPVKGDTHLKITALSVIEEITKIRNKLRDDEEHTLRVESEKMRAMQWYLLEKRVTTENVLEPYRPILTECIRKVEEQDFDSGWCYVNESGFLSDYSELLAELQNKIIFLKKILRDQTEFVAAVRAIHEGRKQAQNGRSSFVLYRYVSAGEFQSLKEHGGFTQNIRYSTAENAKWFFYGKGNPGVTNEYLCEVVCGASAGELIKGYNAYPKAILVKDNEPDCVGIHEEVLAHFNLLISSIKVTHVQSKKSVEIKPDPSTNPTQPLISSLSASPDSSLYFSMH